MLRRKYQRIVAQQVLAAMSTTPTEPSSDRHWACSHAPLVDRIATKSLQTKYMQAAGYRIWRGPSNQLHDRHIRVCSSGINGTHYNARVQMASAFSYRDHGPFGSLDEKNESFGCPATAGDVQHARPWIPSGHATLHTPHK